MFLPRWQERRQWISSNNKMCKEHKGEGGYRLLGKNRVISIEIFMFKEIKIITFTFEFAKFTGLLSWKSVVMGLTEDY